MKTKKPKVRSSQYREKLLFVTDGQRVAWITNDGDGGEPPNLCEGSLIKVTGLSGSSVVFTGLELNDLCAQWLNYDVSKKGKNQNRVNRKSL